MRKTSLHALLLATILSFSIVPGAHAASISFEVSPATPALTQEFEVSVFLFTEGDSLNAIDGSITIPRDVFIRAISTGGSAFSLWPAPPNFAPKEGVIAFTGGVPGGISKSARILLFTFRAEVNETGEYPFLAQATAFRNDGTGSSFDIPAASHVLNVIQQETARLPQIKDSRPPDIVSAEIGSDPALFDGHAYLSLFATDDASGVSRYEVKEGWFGSYVPADRYYVLEDQSRSTDIWVRIVDNAGNSVTRRMPSQHPNKMIWYAAGILLILIAILAARRYRRAAA